MQRASLRFYDVPTADGSTIRAWTNDGTGPTIVLSNGLGTSPWAWPSLICAENEFRIISWNHRGVGGSQRPRNGKVTIDTFLDDALAVMDHAGLESAPFLGWSAGVNVAFEMAVRHPERISGLLAVAGVPGGTVNTMLQPLFVPPLVTRGVMRSLSHAVRIGGPAIRPVSRNLPWNTRTANMLRRSRLIKPQAAAADILAAAQEFCTTDPGWYAQLALGIMDHSRVSLSRVNLPVSFLAGDWDLLAGARAMRTAAERLPDSRFRQLRATHFIPLEYPDVIIDELQALQSRIQRGPVASASDLVL